MVNLDSTKLTELSYLDREAQQSMFYRGNNMNFITFGMFIRFILTLTQFSNP